MKIYTIYDSKVQAYLQPVFMISRGQCLRSVCEAVSDINNDLCKNAADYTLFEIGEWSEMSGVIKLYESKENLGCLLEFKRVRSSE